MANFIPIMDIETKLLRKQFAQKYLCSEELLIQALYVDEQRFWYVKGKCFSIYISVIHYILYIYSFDSNGKITFHSGSHTMSVKNSVAVWSCIGVNCVPNVLKKLDGRLDTNQYKKLLNAHVFPYCSGRKFIHDYFPVHTAKAVKEFISSNGIQAFEDWPKNSGDLMPLEAVWRQLLKKVDGKFVFNENDLWHELCDSWDAMDLEGNLVDSIHTLPNRLRHVVKHDGDWVSDNDVE